jgi:glycosyltransferase involved in cell wall biosynthesis
VVEFSIITPSLNMASYLRRACASVTDQRGVGIEHLVMDGGSTDGTVPWLRQQSNLTFVSEPDRGMYDAINKGIARSRGEFVAYLNCDEQYLPGALAAVRDQFRARPEIDLVFGSTILVRPDGSLIAHRKVYPVRALYVRASYFYAPPGGMFVRRRVFDSGHRFDANVRVIGDKLFALGCLEAGRRAAMLRQFVAAFTITGKNLGQSPTASREVTSFRQSSPATVRTLRLPLNVLRLAEKSLAGAYVAPRVRYSVHLDDSGERRNFDYRFPSQSWPRAV